jgi:hypothetical protein
MSRLLHEIENNPDTESFLKENGKKFSQDCVTAMKLMYQGVRLNGETCKHLYGISDRRLRDCIAGRPDIVRKEWVVGKDGKRKVVEYFIPPIITPSKAKVIEWATKFLDGQKGSQLNLL